MSLTCLPRIICFLFFSVLGLTFSAYAGEGRITKAFETTYDFDKNGKLVSTHKPDGNEIKYLYDEKGHLKQVESPEGTTSIIYDAVGNCIGVKNEDGETRYSYDALNRIKSAKFKYNSFVKEINYDYDPWGRISETKILSEKGSREHYMRYSYDIVGRVSSIETNHRKITYKYDPENLKITRSLPSGIKSIFTYQNDSRLRSINHLDREGNSLAQFTYSYRPDGLLSLAKEKIQGKEITIDYDYDKVGRLTTCKCSDGRAYSHKYDVRGNRTILEGPNGIMRSQYDWTGKLTKWGNNKFSHDFNGNIIKWENPQNTMKFNYDSANRLTSIKIGDENIRYDYSAEGLLNKRVFGKLSTTYIHDPRFSDSRALASYQSDGSKSYNIWSHHLLGTVTDGRVTFNLEDAFSRTRIKTNITGQILETNELPSFEMPKIETFRTNIMSGIEPTFLDNRQHLRDIGNTLKTNFYRPFEFLRSTNLIGYRPQDYGNPMYDRARELVELGTKLPIPSQTELRAYDKYWESGQYMLDDPYYKEVIGPLNSSTWAPEKGKYSDMVEFSRKSFRTWIPGYAQVEDVFRAGVSGWMKVYGGLIENVFRGIDKDFAEAGIQVAPTPSIDDYINDLGIRPTGKDFIGDVISTWVPNRFEPIQKVSGILGKWEWAKGAFNLFSGDGIRSSDAVSHPGYTAKGIDDWKQVKVRNITKAKNLKPGDLIFFKGLGIV